MDDIEASQSFPSSASEITEALIELEDGWSAYSDWNRERDNHEANFDWSRINNARSRLETIYREQQQEIERLKSRMERRWANAGASQCETELRAELASLKRENERLRADIEKGYSDIYKTQLRYREMARETTERYGFKEGELQSLWRGLDCFKRKYDQGEVVAAICDALTREGCTAWPGDGTSCVEQMIRLQWERAEKVEAELASLKEEQLTEEERIWAYTGWLHHYRNTTLRIPECACVKCENLRAKLHALSTKGTAEK